MRPPSIFDNTFMSNRSYCIIGYGDINTIPLPPSTDECPNVTASSMYEIKRLDVLEAVVNRAVHEILLTLKLDVKEVTVRIR